MLFVRTRKSRSGRLTEKVIVLNMTKTENQEKFVLLLKKEEIVNLVREKLKSSVMLK